MTQSQPSSAAVVAALNEPSGLCAFTVKKMSPRPKKERNYKHAAAVSSGSTLRTGLLSLRALNDIRRTSGNLEGLAVTPSVWVCHPPNLNDSAEGLWRVWETNRDKWSDFGSWFHLLRKENASTLQLIHLCHYLPFSRGPCSPTLLVFACVESMIVHGFCKLITSFISQVMAVWMKIPAK